MQLSQKKMKKWKFHQKMNSIRLNEHLIQSNPIESMQFNGGKGADWKLLFRLERV